MRKLLSLLLVAVMLLSTLMLSSCDFLDTVGGFFGGLFGGDETVEDNIRRTITEMEWRKVYSAKNFTMYGEIDGERLNLTFAEGAMAINYHGIDALIDLNTGAIIGKNGNGYVGIDMGSNTGIASDFIGMANLTLGQLEILPEFEYSELVYNEESKSYSAKDERTLCEFHFEEGNLVYALMVPADVNEEGKIEIRNVGTTILEIPEYSNITDGIIEPSKAGKDVVTTVTDEQILAHLDMPNLTVSASLILANIVLKGTETATEVKVTSFGEISQHAYITLIDGTVYNIEREYNGDYVAYIMGEQINSMEEALEEIKPYLSTEYLVYNEEGRYYELEVEGTNIYFYFENGQLVQIVVMTSNAPVNGVNIEIIFTISDVGTTTIDLPEYTIKN